MAILTMAILTMATLTMAIAEGGEALLWLLLTRAIPAAEGDEAAEAVDQKVLEHQRRLGCR